MKTKEELVQLVKELLELDSKQAWGTKRNPQQLEIEKILFQNHLMDENGDFVENLPLYIREVLREYGLW
jgi:hypothetical protein